MTGFYKPFPFVLSDSKTKLEIQRRRNKELASFIALIDVLTMEISGGVGRSIRYNARVFTTWDGTFISNHYEQGDTAAFFLGVQPGREGIEQFPFIL